MALIDMQLSFSPDQLAAWNSTHRERQKRVFLAQAHATWVEHFPRLMPGHEPQAETVVWRYLDQGYDACVRRGILEKPLILQFLFAIQRAVHLGCSAAFLQEMCQYFLDRESNHEQALAWIDYVLSGRFHRDLAPRSP